MALMQRSSMSRYIDDPDEDDDLQPGDLGENDIEENDEADGSSPMSPYFAEPDDTQDVSEGRGSGDAAASATSGGSPGGLIQPVSRPDSYDTTLDRVEKIRRTFDQGGAQVSTPALDAYGAHAAKMPQDSRTAKGWKGALGTAIGAISGYMNATGRTRPIDVQPTLQQLKRPKGMDDWQRQNEILRRNAEIEQQKNQQTQRAREANAREFQYAAGMERAMRPPTPPRQVTKIDPTAPEQVNQRAETAKARGWITENNEEKVPGATRWVAEGRWGTPTKPATPPRPASTPYGVLQDPNASEDVKKMAKAELAARTARLNRSNQPKSNEDKPLTERQRMTESDKATRERRMADQAAEAEYSRWRREAIKEGTFSEDENQERVAELNRKKQVNEDNYKDVASRLAGQEMPRVEYGKSRPQARPVQGSRPQQQAPRQAPPSAQGQPKQIVKSAALPAIAKRNGLTVDQLKQRLQAEGIEVR